MLAASSSIRSPRPVRRTLALDGTSLLRAICWTWLVVMMAFMVFLLGFEVQAQKARLNLCPSARPGVARAGRICGVWVRAQRAKRVSHGPADCACAARGAWPRRKLH